MASRAKMPLRTYGCSAGVYCTGRSALRWSKRGKVGVGRFSDHVRLLCSSFDPAHGTYNLLVSRLLAATGMITLLVLGSGIALLSLVSRCQHSLMNRRTAEFDPFEQQREWNHERCEDRKGV